MNDRQERRAQVDRWAVLIESSGLSAVVLSLVEAADAFGFLGHQALLAIEPLVRDISGKTMERPEGPREIADVWAQLRAQLTRGRGSDE